MSYSLEQIAISAGWAVSMAAGVLLFPRIVRFLMAVGLLGKEKYAAWKAMPKAARPALLRFAYSEVFREDILPKVEAVIPKKADIAGAVVAEVEAKLTPVRDEIERLKVSFAPLLQRAPLIGEDGKPLLNEDGTPKTANAVLLQMNELLEQADRVAAAMSMLMTVEVEHEGKKVRVAALENLEALIIPILNKWYASQEAKGMNALAQDAKQARLEAEARLLAEYNEKAQDPAFRQQLENGAEAMEMKDFLKDLAVKNLKVSEDRFEKVYAYAQRKGMLSSGGEGGPGRSGGRSGGAEKLGL